jgi:crotonobetainyl-CoA:carnitine CoA-transferase CaiB-like acyl-CoA transferase
VRGGRDFAGPSPADRFYRAADGWLRVQAADVDTLAAALGAAGDASAAHAAPDVERCDAVAEVFASMPVASALARLREAGVAAVPARPPLAVVHDPVLQAADLFSMRTFPDGTPYLVPRGFARFGRSGCAAVADAPGVGEHSRELLAHAGLSAAEIDALVAEGVVIEGKPLVLTGFVNYR